MLKKNYRFMLLENVHVDENMSVELVDELGVGSEEVSIRHGGDLGVR